MSWKNLLCLTVVGAFLANSAVADPLASLSGVPNGGAFDWTLSFAPDAGLFTDPADDTPDQGLGGSIATAFQLEVASGGFSNVAVMTPDFMETINTTDIINPGFNPYTSSITEDISQHAGVASDLGTGTVDAMFVPLGSTFFTSGGDKGALTFSTTVDTVSFGGLVAQAGDEYTLAADSSTANASFPLGDFTGDGKVDGADLSLLLGNWGVAVPPNPAGWDGTPPTTPLVDGDDLSALLGTWGVGVGASVGLSNVPEPTAVISSLLGFSAMGLVLRRRNK